MRTLILLPLVVLGFAFPCRAWAQTAADSLYPLRSLDRPTTLPRRAARLDLIALGSHQESSPTGASLIIGGGLGVTKSLEVGGQVIPVSLAPGSVEFLTPSLYVTYALSAGKASIAPIAQAVFPVRDSDPFFWDLAVSVDVPVGSAGNLALAPTISVDTRESGLGTTMAIPVTYTRQVTPNFSWQIASGFGLSRFDPRFGISRRSQVFDFNDETIPLSVTALYSVARRGTGHPIADLIAQWQWPQLYSRVRNAGSVVGSDWGLQLQLSLYRLP